MGEVYCSTIRCVISIMGLGCCVSEFLKGQKTKKTRDAKREGSIIGAMTRHETFQLLQDGESLVTDHIPFAQLSQ